MAMKHTTARSRSTLPPQPTMMRSSRASTPSQPLSKLKSTSMSCVSNFWHKFYLNSYQRSHSLWNFSTIMRVRNNEIAIHQIDTDDSCAILILMMIPLFFSAVSVASVEVLVDSTNVPLECKVDNLKVPSDGSKISYEWKNAAVSTHVCLCMAIHSGGNWDLQHYS